MTDYDEIERIEVKRDGAKPTKNSGRGYITKGDAILDGLITIDYKYTDRSFGLSRKVWAKLTSDALKNRTQEQALKVILGEDKLRLWVIDDVFFKEMYEAWCELNGS